LQISFVWVNTDVEFNARIVRLFSLKTEDLPAIRLMLIREIITKFNLDFTVKTVEFVGNCWCRPHLQTTSNEQQLGSTPPCMTSAEKPIDEVHVSEKRKSTTVIRINRTSVRQSRRGNRERGDGERGERRLRACAGHGQAVRKRVW
jgi:hypothetical protein